MKITKNKLVVAFIVGSLFSTIGSLRLEAASADELFQNAFVAETSERNIEKAIETYQEAADQAKDDPALISKAEYRMGLCYELLGKVPEAMAAYDNALKLSISLPNEASENARISLYRLKQSQEKVEQAKLLSEQTRQIQEKAAERNIYNIKKGSQILAFSGGLTIPLTRETLGVATPGNIGFIGDELYTPAAEGEGTIGALGPSIGADYSYYLSPHFAIGLNALYSRYLPSDNSVTVKNFVTNPFDFSSDTTQGTDKVESGGTSYVFLPTLRIELSPQGRIHPFVMGGIGFHHTQLRVSHTLELDDIEETRSGIVTPISLSHTYTSKYNTTNMAYMIGAGIDYSLTKNIIVGLAGSWMTLKNAVNAELLRPRGFLTLNDVSNEKYDKLFNVHVNNSISTVNLMARVGYKFK